MLRVGKRNVKNKLRDCEEKVKVTFWKSYDNYFTSLSIYNKLVKLASWKRAGSWKQAEN